MGRTQTLSPPFSTVGKINKTIIFVLLPGRDVIWVLIGPAVSHVDGEVQVRVVRRWRGFKRKSPDERYTGSSHPISSFSSVP